MSRSWGPPYLSLSPHTDHVITLGSFSVYWQGIHGGLFQWSQYILGWSLEPPQQKKFKRNVELLAWYLISNKIQHLSSHYKTRRLDPNSKPSLDSSDIYWQPCVSSYHRPGVVKHLPSLCPVLGSSPSTAKKENSWAVETAQWIECRSLAAT